jgi:uncharacterized membrane protein
MRVNPVALATILGMAIATYITRAGGLWLISRATVSPRLERCLRHLPGSILAAIVAPAVLTAGPAEAVAASCTVLVAALTQNLFLAIIAGVAVVWILRTLISA